MAARLPRPGRGRRPLVGHDHLGQGPASRWAGPTISASTSRSGTAGPRGGSGRAGAIRATSGASRTPALREGSACFWHAAESPEPPPRRAGSGGSAAGARGRSGAPTPWRGSARTRICGAPWSWTTRSHAPGRWPTWWPWRPGSRRPPSSRRACGRWRTASGGRSPLRARRRRADARLHAVAARMTVPQRVAALLHTGPGNATLHDDICRGLTPAGWAELRRCCARVDQLNATARVCLTRAGSAIDMLLGIAYRRSTTTLLAILAEDLQDALDGWQPRRGRTRRALGAAGAGRGLGAPRRHRAPGGGRRAGTRRRRDAPAPLTSLPFPRASPSPRCPHRSAGRRPRALGRGAGRLVADGT